MKLKFTLIADPSGRIRSLVQALGDSGKKELNDGASSALHADVRKHLRSYAASHHKSANKLGAMPTGHLEKAAATMQHASSSTEATVSIYSPGIGRAFRSMTIRPTRARALTIPIHALAYGMRVAEVARAHTIFRPKKADYLATVIDGQITPLYLLRQAVTVPQERGLMPSDGAMQSSVRRGYLGVIQNVINKLRMGA